MAKRIELWNPARPVLGLGLLLLMSWWSPAGGQSLCTEPLIPTCIELESTYEAPETIKRCRMDIETYKERMREFEQCLKQEGREASSLPDRVAKRFDCKLRQDRQCPPAPDSTSSM